MNFSITDFEIGFEKAVYTIGEEAGLVEEAVFLVKMEPDNILLKDYQLIVSVKHSFGPYPAILGTNQTLSYFLFRISNIMH